MPATHWRLAVKKYRAQGAKVGAVVAVDLRKICVKAK